MSLRFSRQAMLAGVIVLGAIAGIGPSLSAVIGSVYQDEVQETGSGGSANINVKFKLFSSTQSLVIQTVTCRIEGTSTPPHGVQLTGTDANTVVVQLPFQFAGQTSTKQVWTVHATNVYFGVPKNFRPQITAFWSNTGLGTLLRCSITGDLR